MADRVATLPGESSGVLFYVLGPLRVEAPRQEIRIDGMRRRGVLRGVLLRLLASPGRSVPVDVLAGDVWEGDLPAAAASTLQSHVSALRQAIGSDRLVFGDRGYRLRVQVSELDSLTFEQDVATGRAANLAGDFESAAVALDRAFARWRGQACYWLSCDGCVREPDGAVNHRVEHLVTESLHHAGQHLAGVQRARVVHGGKQDV